MYRILAFTFKRGGELSFIEKYLSNLSSPTLRIVGQSQSEDAGNMEKYAVQINDGLTKLSSKEKLCPICSSILLTTTNIPKCPKCGTEPFESKKE
jgi:ribosomal protein S27AE